MNEAIEKTKRWVEQVVIGWNLCPFARPVKDQIRWATINQADAAARVAMVLEEIAYLETHTTWATTLCVYPEHLTDFEAYLDELAWIEEALEAYGYRGRYQVASFHPAYQFSGTAMNAAENYTNRSPYPVVHLIREDLLAEALEEVAHPERIPERNIAYMQEKGTRVLQALWAKEGWAK